MFTTKIGGQIIHPMAYLMEIIAKKEGIKYTNFNNGEIIRLEKDDKIKLIQGYKIPINSSSSSAVCKDKSASSDIMKQFNIPQIRHYLFLNPALGDWTPKSGSWPLIHECAKKHDYRVVCKTKDGSGGKGVYLINNPRELEQAVAKIFDSNRDLVISGFKPFKHEYRVLVYKNSVELILKKILPTVIGDGKKNIQELIFDYLSKVDLSKKKDLIPFMQENLLFSKEIPVEGKEIQLDWKHNGSCTMTEIIGGQSFYDVTNSDNKDIDDELLVKL
jgi:hypothetical protein